MRPELRMSKVSRKRATDARKAALVASGHVYRDLARLADVSYSMAWKWMNLRRTSADCQRAFDVLTARTARKTA
jgi:hypothetical protein